MLRIGFIYSHLLVMLLGVGLCTAQAFAQQGPSNLNISGGLFLPSGLPVTESNVNFRLEIWDKASTCLLYSEEHLSEDLSQTEGGFALAIGKGTNPNNYLESSAVLTSKIFENSGVVAGGWANCAGGTNGWRAKFSIWRASHWSYSISQNRPHFAHSSAGKCR